MLSDEVFLKRLAASRPAVRKAARWLRERYPELRFLVVPPRVRPSYAERAAYRDVGDIEQCAVTGYVEVKVRNRDFTGADDYPWPTVFVDECYKVDERDEPRNHIIYNRDLSVLCWVPASTRDEWVVVSTRDGPSARETLSYACPVDLCEFIPVGDDADTEDDEGVED